MSGRPNPNPQLAVSTKSTAANLTGTWRFERPVFVNRVAPCNEACPLGQDIDSIMALQARGEVGAALSKILLENPFPGWCGVHCHAPCERACNRGRFDQPVSIRDLELFASQHIRPLALERPAGTAGASVAVVGRGLAAWSCAWFLLRLGHRVTLFSAGAGGPEEPPAPGWTREREGIVSAGVAWDDSTPVGADVAADLSSGFQGIFVEPGLGEDRPPRAALRSREFLRKTGVDRSGVGRCPVLIGFGAQALKVAEVMRQSGREAAILSAGDRPESLEEPKETKFHWRTGVLGIVREAGHLRGLLCRQAEKEFELAADQVILCLGERNDLEFEPPQLVSGTVMVAPPARPRRGSERSLVGLIAQGKGAALGLDLGLRKRALQELARSAVGRRGALSLEAYLNPGSDRRWREVAPFEELNLDHFKQSGRISPGSETGSLTPNQALRSARRCFNCGICTFCSKCEEFCPDLSVAIDPVNRTRSIDYDHCKGCGICAEECPRGAIGWLPE